MSLWPRGQVRRWVQGSAALLQESRREQGNRQRRRPQLYQVRLPNGQGLLAVHMLSGSKGRSKNLRLFMNDNYFFTTSWLISSKLMISLFLYGFVLHKKQIIETRTCKSRHWPFLSKSLWVADRLLRIILPLLLSFFFYELVLMLETPSRGWWKVGPFSSGIMRWSREIVFQPSMVPAGLRRLIMECSYFMMTALLWSVLLFYIMSVSWFPLVFEAFFSNRSLRFRSLWSFLGRMSTRPRCKTFSESIAGWKSLFYLSLTKFSTHLLPHSPQNTIY